MPENGARADEHGAGTHADERIRLGVDQRLAQGSAVGHSAIGRHLIEPMGDLVEVVTVHTVAAPGEPTPSDVRERIHAMEKQGLDGFVYSADRTDEFVHTFRELLPQVPTEEDGRLDDPAVREVFITSVFSLRRWRRVLAQGCTVGGLVDFHSRHKLLILAHDEAVYRRMGRLVAGGERAAGDRLFADYQILLLKALATPTTPGRHVNVLQHILGYFKHIPDEEKHEALTLIDAYKRGLARRAGAGATAVWWRRGERRRGCAREQGTPRSPRVTRTLRHRRTGRRPTR